MLFKGHRILNLVIFIAILVFFCNTYYHEMLHIIPSGIHAWAQSDRLSLAICFYDNEMNFFKPATHNVYSAGGVTGVEFPLQAYLAAIAGKIFGRIHISTCFRLIDVLISCTGLVFLFLACFKRTKDFVFSMATPLFAFCSPIFIYYTCNYLPDAAAVSILFIAFYFILDYLDKSRNRDLLWALAILTLSTLIKTSTGLYLIGFMGLVVIQRLQRNKYSSKDNLVLLAATLTALLLPVAYYFYNQYLNHTYHSTVFLAAANPFESYKAFHEYIDIHFKHVWMREYLELPQYLFATVVIVVGLPFLKHIGAGRYYTVLSLLFVAGVLGMGYLMGGQLRFHDYYVLSIILPLLIYILLIATIAIRLQTDQPIALKAARRGLIAAVLIMFFFADFHSHQRLRPDYYPFGPGKPFAENGALLMDKLGISKDERIFTLDAAPNATLVLCDRKGYNYPEEKWTPLSNVVTVMGKLKVRVLACPADLIAHIENEPTAKGRFHLLGMQDRLAVFELK